MGVKQTVIWCKYKPIKIAIRCRVINPKAKNPLFFIFHILKTDMKGEKYHGKTDREI